MACSMIFCWLGLKGDTLLPPHLAIACHNAMGWRRHCCSAALHFG